jgi:hypothetical protein
MKTMSLLLIVCLLSPTLAAAAEPAGPIAAAMAREAVRQAPGQPGDAAFEVTWARVTALKPGTRIVITLRDGSRMDQAFISGDEHAIVVSKDAKSGTVTKAAESVPRSAVLEVRRPAENPGSPGGGVAFGVLGALFLGAPLAFALLSDVQCQPGCSDVRLAAFGMTMGTGVGLGYVGYKTLGRKSERVLYRVPVVP